MPLTLPNWTLIDSHVQNGRHIFENLGDLKPTLVVRYERWASRNPEEAARARVTAEQAAKQPDEYQDVGRYPAQDESGWQAQEATRRDSGRRREEEKRRDEYRNRPPNPRLFTLIGDSNSNGNDDGQDGNDDGHKGRKEEEKINCGVCFENVPVVLGHLFNPCQHWLCRPCITGHVRAKINERRFAPCAWLIRGMRGPRVCLFELDPEIVY